MGLAYSPRIRLSSSAHYSAMLRVLKKGCFRSLYTSNRLAGSYFSIREQGGAFLLFVGVIDTTTPRPIYTHQCFQHS